MCLTLFMLLLLSSKTMQGQGEIAYFHASRVQTASPEWNTPFHAQVVDFRARRIGADVRLEWRTLREIGNRAFEIQRASSSSRGWRSIGSIPGGADGDLPRSYNFHDKRVPEEDLRYMLRITGHDERIQYSPIITAPATGILRSFDIEAESTRNRAHIIIELMRHDIISLELTDGSGTVIDRILAARKLPSGRHSFAMDCSSMPEGSYELQLETSEGRYTRDYQHRR